MDDERILAATEEAFFDELGKIKEAGFGKFITKGLRGWTSVAKGKTPIGSVWKGLKSSYARGAKDGGVLGGIRGAMGSTAGSMVAIPTTLAAGGAVAHKALGGGGQRRQY